MAASNAPRDSNTSWQVAVDYSVISDIGMRRMNNQDSAFVQLADSPEAWEKFGHFFIVADGMGAHAAGELASKMAVERVPHHYRKLQIPLPAEALERAVQEANSEIYRRGQANAEFRNMGTTASMLLLLPEGAVCAHVGDSRVYMQRGDQVDQLTFDHSLVWEMQAAGEVTEESARSGLIPKNVITRSLGPNPMVQVDMEGPFPIKLGDRFLLCSDGLSGQVTDEEIGALLSVLPPGRAAQILVDLANLRGGPDNITAIVVEITGQGIVTSKAAQRSTPRATTPNVPTRFSIALGLVAGACLLASLGFLAYSQWPLAIVAAILSVVALATGVVQRQNNELNDPRRSERYGRGPHRRYSSKPNDAFSERLAGTLKALREAAEERKWQIDLKKLDDAFRSANAALAKQDFTNAVREFSNAIIDTMQQIRRQRDREASDSKIEY